MLLYPAGVNRFLAHPTTSIRAASSQASMRMTVRLFQSSYPDLELHELNPRHLEDWIGKKIAEGTSESTLKKYIQRLSRFLDWCSWQQLIDRNPAEHLDKVLKLHPQPVRQARWLDEEEVRIILDSIDLSTLLARRDSIILRLGFLAGLRNAEIRMLALSSLSDVEKERIIVKGKGGKLAQVYVPPKTASLLLEWRDSYEEPSPDAPVVIGFRSLLDWTSGERSMVPQWGTGISQQALGRIVSSRSSAVGLRVAPHDMRRTYAGIMERKVGLIETSRAMRHSQIATTQIYLERRQDSAFQAGRIAGVDI